MLFLERLAGHLHLLAQVWVIDGGKAVCGFDLRDTMAQTERREAERREDTTPISMVIADSQELEGQAMNLSATDVLLRAKGDISVFLTINGKRYRGRLVRGFPVEPGTTAWAVQLDHRAEEP